MVRTKARRAPAKKKIPEEATAKAPAKKTNGEIKLKNEQRLELFNCLLKRKLVDTQYKAALDKVAAEEAFILDRLGKEYGADFNEYQLDPDTGICTKAPAPPALPTELEIPSK